MWTYLSCNRQCSYYINLVLRKSYSLCFAFFVLGLSWAVKKESKDTRRYRDTLTSPITMATAFTVNQGSPLANITEMWARTNQHADVNIYSSLGPLPKSRHYVKSEERAWLGYTTFSHLSYSIPGRDEEEHKSTWRASYTSITKSSVPTTSACQHHPPAPHPYAAQQS